jgi:hypothetical protein
MRKLFLISLLLHIILISHAQIDSVIVDNADIDTIFIDVHISHHKGNFYFTDSTIYLIVGDTIKIQFYQTESCEFVTCGLCPEIRKIKILKGVYKYAVFDLFTKDSNIVGLPDSCDYTEYYLLSSDSLNLSHVNAVNLNNYPGLIIYPNPVARELVVHNTTNRSEPIQIFDINGKILIEKVISGIEVINVTHLPVGVYIYRANNSTGYVQSGRFVVQ